MFDGSDIISIPIGPQISIDRPKVVISRNVWFENRMQGSLSLRGEGFWIPEYKTVPSVVLSFSKTPSIPRSAQGVSARADDITGLLPV